MTNKLAAVDRGDEPEPLKRLKREMGVALHEEDYATAGAHLPLHLLGKPAPEAHVYQCLVHCSARSALVSAFIFLNSYVDLSHLAQCVHANCACAAAIWVSNMLCGWLCSAHP